MRMLLAHLKIWDKGKGEGCVFGRRTAAASQISIVTNTKWCRFTKGMIRFAANFGLDGICALRKTRHISFAKGFLH